MRLNKCTPNTKPDASRVHLDKTVVMYDGLQHKWTVHVGKASLISSPKMLPLNGKELRDEKVWGSPYKRAVLKSLKS